MTDNCIGQCQAMQRVLVDEEVPIPDAQIKLIIHGIPAFVCPSCSGRELPSRVRQELCEFKLLFLANATQLALAGENINVDFRLTFE